MLYNFTQKHIEAGRAFFFALTSTKSKSCWEFLHVEASKALFLGAHTYRKIRC